MFELTKIESTVTIEAGTTPGKLARRIGPSRLNEDETDMTDNCTMVLM